MTFIRLAPDPNTVILTQEGSYNRQDSTRFKHQDLASLLLLFSCLLYSTPGLASSTVEVPLKTGQSLIVEQFSATGQVLVIWLPSERGLRPEYQSTANSLSSLGIDVWAVDLHASYMEPPGKSSITIVDPEDIRLLIQRAHAQHFTQIVILTAGRTATLALTVAELMSAATSESNLLDGLIFLHPYLMEETPAPGKNAEYKTTALRSFLPIYLIQPEFSPKFMRAAEIRNVLTTGGSPVYLHVLRGVSGGFHMRPEDELSDTDLAMKQQFPKIVRSSIALLSQTQHAQKAITITQSPIVTVDQPISKKSINLSLNPYQGNPNPAEMVLYDLLGKLTDLRHEKGSVVLLNFWATWCGPCVEEIPSLGRLINLLDKADFKVISINIGEDIPTIKKFIQKYPIDFPVLLDKNGATVRDWKVYTYPSNYLLDKQGQIRYAYNGALEWDKPQVLSIIKQLINEK